MSAERLLELLQDVPEKLAAVQRFLAQQSSAGRQQNPADKPLPAPAQAPGPGPLTATIEGDPASGCFCIRFVGANGGNPAPPTQSTGTHPEMLGMAAKVFQLLTALNPGNRLRKAPPIKVFLLRYRQNLSRPEIARACGCSLPLVAVRLRAIQEKLPWHPQQLREMSAQVEAMQDAFNDSRARRIYRKGAVYGDEGEEEGYD